MGRPVRYVVVRGTLPKGLRIRKDRFGHGIVAMRSFKKGTVLAVFKNGVARTGGRGDPFSLKVPGTRWHWCFEDPGRMTWDALINHDENCNVRYEFSKFSKNRIRVPLIVIKDIKKGQELTLNYHSYGDRVLKAKRYHTHVDSIV